MPIVKALRSIVRKNSAGSDFARRRINLIEGANITLTVADDSTNNEIDITIAGASSSTSPGGNDTEIQYNNGGSFGGVSVLTYNDSNDNLVFNEAGGDNDFRMEGDTDPNLIFLDASTDFVGIGTAAPVQKLDVLGNFNVKNADVATKAYRFRTSGGSLDLEAGGADLYLSIWENADFSGSQYQLIQLQKNGDPILFKRGVTFNSDASGDQDFRIKGDTDDNMLFADVSLNSIGIGEGTILAKLHIKGAGSTSSTNALLVKNSSGDIIINARDNQTVSIGADSDPDGWARFYVASGGFRADDDFRFKKGSGSQYITRSGGTGYDLVFQCGGDNLILYGGGAGVGGVMLAATGQLLGFYGTTPIAKQTGVAVSSAGIHGALVNLGLIAA